MEEETRFHDIIFINNPELLPPYVKLCLYNINYMHIISVCMLNITIFLKY